MRCSHAPDILHFCRFFPGVSSHLNSGIIIVEGRQSVIIFRKQGKNESEVVEHAHVWSQRWVAWYNLVRQLVDNRNSVQKGPSELDSFVLGARQTPPLLMSILRRRRVRDQARSGVFLGYVLIYSVRDIPLAQWLVDLGYLLQFAPNRHSSSHAISHSRK